MSSKRWTAEQIGDKSGLVAVVTGASAGLGRITALELARHQARVVLAVRDRAKGEQTASWISDQVPGAQVEVRVLDLSGLGSVRDFAADMHTDFDRLDLLIHNAGVMRTPPGWTEDGFETQLAVNHLGPFALTGLLHPLLSAAGPARVVTVSSTEHKPGVINFDDLQSRQDYHPRRAYQQSKLAVTTFALELDQRLRQADSKVISVLAHPGISRTNLINSGFTGATAVAVRLGQRLFAQSAQRGALPQLYAACAPGVAGGQFFGPGGPGEARGPVALVRPAAAATDPDLARRLWAVSEQLTEVRWNPAATPGSTPW